MAMTASEKQLAYQARRMVKIMALPEAEREAELERLREIARKAQRKHYANNREIRNAEQSARDKANRRAKAVEEGRQFGRVGIEIAASPEEKAARKAAKRERKRIYDAARYPEIRDEKIASALRYYRENTEAVLERMRAYYETHVEQYLAHAHKRRTKLNQAGGFYTVGDLANIFSQQKGICLFCGDTLGEDKPAIDHWVPVKLGGSSHPDNIALLHRRCNSRKAARMPSDFGLPDSPIPLREALQRRLASEMAPEKGT